MRNNQRRPIKFSSGRGEIEAKNIPLAGMFYREFDHYMSAGGGGVLLEVGKLSLIHI